MTLSPDGYALDRDGGDAFWFLGTRMTVKAGDDQTGGAFTLIDCQCPPGFAPPAHVHHQEDEAFYLLGGSLQVSCGDETWQVEPGGFVFLPKGRPHRFVVLGEEGARLLQITAPAQFERFAADVGVPATGPGLPEPEAPDLQRLFAAAAAHHIEILPPGAA